MAACARVLRAAAYCTVLAGCGDDDDARPIDCTVFTAAAVSPYLLPWHLGQTYSGYPHLTWDPTVQRYAIDAPMPIGTDVLAMRAGTVVRVRESFFDNDLTPGHENYVYVQHGDGTVARYFHLTHDGVLPMVGDVVPQGEPIARSGHTGLSKAPHLHFDVTRSCCAEPPAGNALPAGETLPLSFAHATPDSSCGIVEGVSYTAQP